MKSPTELLAHYQEHMQERSHPLAFVAGAVAEQAALLDLLMDEVEDVALKRKLLNRLSARATEYGRVTCEIAAHLLDLDNPNALE